MLILSAATVLLKRIDDLLEVGDHLAKVLEAPLVVVGLL